MFIKIVLSHTLETLSYIAHNKMVLVHDLTSDSQLDILVLALSEIWFRPNDPPAVTDAIELDGFTILNVICLRLS